MNRLIKGILLVMVLVYVASPADLCQGPVDDIIVLLLGMAAQKSLDLNKEKARS